MKTQDHWNAFYHSGRIGDYLQYACTSEESQLRQDNSCKQERRQEDAGDRDGNGAFGITYGRIR